MLDDKHRRRDEIPGGESHPEPVDVPDEERPAVKDPDATRASHPVRGGMIRRVMVISLALVIAIFAVLYAIFA